MHDDILAFLKSPTYRPLKPKALAARMGVAAGRMTPFRQALRDLAAQGRVHLDGGHAVKLTRTQGAFVGTFRRTAGGRAVVKPLPVNGVAGPEVRIGADDALDAAPGDTVEVRIVRKPARGDTSPLGAVLRVVERATATFVGTYFERDAQGLVRVDGNVFARSVFVGDPGAKGAKPDDKVVIEMVRFPAVDGRGEGVIAEVLGARGAPGVDLLAVIRSYQLPDAFPEEALAEARQQAAAFRETDLAGREDLTADLIITIDPADARDFDDAISLTRDAKSGHWLLGVHIADVAHFAPPGSALDREARMRATSIYLPQRVIPMFPEVISNGLASLQAGKVRYTKSVHMEFTAAGAVVGARFSNSAIKARQRFSYEQVMALLDQFPDTEPPEALPGDLICPRDVLELLLRMRTLAVLLRARRRKRGSLELDMPETVLEYDADGAVSGAHFAVNDLSHQIIEAFMLAANEAVAAHFAALEVPFLRRVHPAPDPHKLKGFMAFARELGLKVPKRDTDRFALQSALEQAKDTPIARAVYYAMLRSLKQAAYSPLQEEHFALASDDYCHFTSPIRRYPDLTVHRQLDAWIRKGKVRADLAELTHLGDHCSRMERRAEAAERDLVKSRLLTYMSTRIGTTLTAIITGVADYGFFAQAETMPVEGMVHVSTLPDDYYTYDEESHTLFGRKTKARYRLGDTLTVQVARVDQVRRQLDFRVKRGRDEGKA